MSGTQDQIWKFWSRKYYHDDAAVLNLLNHFHSESFSSHIILVYIFVHTFIKLAIFILFLLSPKVIFFLHCMLNILRWKNILWNWWLDCFIAPSIISGLFIVNPFSLWWSKFFFKKAMFPLVSLSLAYRWVNKPSYFWETYCGVFLENYLPLLNNITNLTWCT